MENTAYKTKEATLSDVQGVATPASTNRWCPIPHNRLLELVRDNVQEKGFSIVNEKHTLTEDGARYFGTMSIETGNPDWNFQVGLRNAHDKRFSAGLVVGNNIFVCSNLCFSGEIKIGKKHTPSIIKELPILVNDAVNRLAPAMEAQGQRFDRYKEKNISNDQAGAGLVRLAMNGVIPSSKILPTYNEFLKPSHSEFRGNNLYNLMNAVTENLKSYALESIPERTINLVGCLDKWSMN